jgi:putative transposon-encoded protein
MYLEPNAKIQIVTKNALLEFNQVNRIVIEESVRDLGNKATITIPRNYQQLDGKNITDILNAGDYVEIWLGYDGGYFKEFTGYITFPEADAPLVLYIDDEFYPLKRNTLKKTFPSGTPLREILNFIAPDYTIDCPDVKLNKFDIPNVSSYRVILAIMEQYGFYTKLKGTVLQCMWPYDMKADIHTYTFYTPTVKKNNLKFQRAEEVKLRVRGISNLRNGTKLKYETGNDEPHTSLRTLNFGPLTQEELNRLTEAEYKRMVFDGFRGNITGFGYPRTHAGDTLKIVDTEVKERSGSYFIEKVKITYDLKTGFERENTLSFKVA